MIRKMLTVGELARILKVKPSWIYERTRKGGSESIPHVRIGKYIRFPEDLVREFIDRHRATGNTK